MNDKNTKEINKTTDLISSLIHEYLFKKDYLKTLDIFQQELSEKIKTGTFYTFLNNDKSLYDSSLLLNYFESGNKQKFMDQWKRIIPNNLKLTEPTLFKLDFNIQIYFSIFPILKPNANINDIRIQKNLKQNMEEFKLYLEQNNTEQFKSPEFLSYYALPYIPDPRKNATYANLFSPEWAKCLKEQIQRCLDYYSPNNINKFPILYDLTRGKKVITINNNISNNLKNNDNININKKTNDDKKIRELILENKNINEENNNLRINYEKNKKVFLDAQKNWCNLALDILSYSFDLISIYYKITNNQKNNIIEEINDKLLKYQNFLVKNYEDLEKNNINKNINEVTNELNSKKLLISNNEEHNNKLVFDQNNITFKKQVDNNNIIIDINNKYENLFNSSNKKNHVKKIDDNANFITNVNNVKKENKNKIINYYSNNLIDMKRFNQALNHQIYIEDEKLAHIFQEIRLRIYNQKNRELRELTLYEIFYYDIFGTQSNSSTIFKHLLSNKNLILEVMKLVNSLANFNCGRNYLLAKNTLIEDIVKCMIAEKSDTELRQNCLGAIQKFTLRNQPQNKLIELNVIHYLVDIFTYQYDYLSDYSKEYGLALLMNLSLRKEGKEKFEAVGEKIIKILIKFLNYDNIQILTCINGMLYSLVKKKKIRELVKNYGIEQKLNDLKKYNNEHINKQIKYITDELNNYSNENNDYNDEEEESFAEEDININDNMDIINNEYPEKNINDEKYKEKHYKILSEFIIPDKELESVEKQNIINFMNENINMTKGLLNNNSNRSNDSSFKKEDNNDLVNNNDEKERDEDLNINDKYIEEENNEEENEDNNIIQEEKNNYGVINENNNDFDDIYGRPDDGFAFKTKDKLKRTPPRKLNI